MRVCSGARATLTGALMIALSAGAERRVICADLEGQPASDRGYVQFTASAIARTPLEHVAARCQARIPNDPFFPRQWHLHNAEEDGADINALEAWELTEGDPSVVIAVVEYGPVDIDHPDLIDNLWSDPEASDPEAPDVHGWDFSGCVGKMLDENEASECSGPLASVESPNDHATPVAGLAAAVGDNGRGVVGVCPRCSFMSIATGRPGKDTLEMAIRRAAAFRFAAENGARIIISTSNPWDSSALLASLDTLSNEHDVIIIVSIGNDNENGCRQGRLSTSAIALAVGASDNHDSRAMFSNHGSCLSLLAPGHMTEAETGTRATGVMTTDLQRLAGMNTGERELSPLCSEVDNADYTACFGGTSAAASIVAGVVGLMLTVNDTLTHDQVKAILERTAEKVDSQTGFSETHGHGRVDAGEAVKCAQEGASCLGSPP